MTLSASSQSAVPHGTASNSDVAFERAALELQLLVSPSSQTLPLIIGALGLMTIAMMGWLDTGQIWFLLWAPVTIVVLATV